MEKSWKKAQAKGEEKKHFEVLGGMSAKLFWEIVRNAKSKEDEKTKLANDMLNLNKDLNNVKEYLENVVENSADMIITTGLDKKIVSFNRGAEKMLGYNRKDVLGKGIDLLWKNKEERDKLLNQLETNGNVSNYDTELVKKNNKTIQASLTLSCLKNQDGEIIGTVGISKDVSEKKKMEKELLRSNQEMEDFVFIISHDLQAPLRAIYGFSDLLADECQESLDDNSLHYLARIKTGAERMKLLIDDLLDLSRIGQHGKMSEKVDIMETLAIIKDFFRFHCKEKNGEIKFVTDFPSTINCNKTRIQQVFNNLVGNAIKFCDKPPIIEIGYKERSDTHEFFVKDNGIGISQNYHRKIFNIFQRLNDSEEYEGTGIGLTIVKKIIELHNGKIWLESASGKGATFYFTIGKEIPNTLE
jgi:PAS domain S-box-containing protein